MALVYYLSIIMNSKQIPNHIIEWQFENNLISYNEAILFMENKINNIANKNANDLIWILEHQHVYTAGVSAKDKDLIANNNIEVIKTNRGGKYTYHGPGIKIIYLMLDLKKFFFPNEPDIAKFINFIEIWIINILKNYNIDGFIRKDRVGVWVFDDKGNEKKISAIGIKIKKWICYHGIAMNINPDLSMFENIIPCGIKDFKTTSLLDLGIANFNNDQFFEIAKNEFYKLKENYFKS